jgi:hypothetical protein
MKVRNSIISIVLLPSSSKYTPFVVFNSLQVLLNRKQLIVIEYCNNAFGYYFVKELSQLVLLVSDVRKIA